MQVSNPVSTNIYIGVNMKIEYNPRIELGSLVNFIAKKKDIDYSEAENLLPSHIFEGSYICDDNTADWCKEVVEYLKENKIDAVEVYQDC